MGDGPRGIETATRNSQLCPGPESGDRLRGRTRTTRDQSWVVNLLGHVTGIKNKQRDTR